MLKIVDQSVWRGGEKIGWLEGNGVYSASGSRKVGYFSDNDIYRIDGTKIGYIEGNYIRTADGRKIRLEENRAHVSGSDESDLARAAVRLLLGD